MIRSIGTAAAGTTVAGGTALGLYAGRNLTRSGRLAARARRAGITTRDVVLSGGLRLRVAEGPEGGIPLLLVHGQASAGASYDAAVADLAADFHVVTVDLPGHGGSDRTPGRYTLGETAAVLAELLAEVFDRPAIVSGHSSGGIVAAALAAQAPEAVRGVVLEDPPFYSTEPDRVAQQFNQIDLALPAHAFLAQDAERDFALWYLEHNAWIGYFGRGAEHIVRAGRRRRERHPDRPLVVWFLPPSINEAYAYMHTFDPHVADAFCRGTWQAGVRHDALLAAVRQPTTLIHANWRITPQKVLEGAMTGWDANRALGALPDGRLERVHTGHGVHVEQPERFAQVVRELAARVAG